MTPVIHACPLMAGRMATLGTDGRLAEDPTSKLGPNDRAMSHRVADSHESSRMEYGHSSREARTGRGAVEATRGDDDSVLRRFTHSLPRAGELDDAHTGDGFVLRVATRQLLAGGLPDPLTGDGQVPGLRRFQAEAQRFRISDRVPHAAVGDINGVVPVPASSNGIELIGKSTARCGASLRGDAPAVT